jgi:phage repressor protein C with HTH and peptisase S24 domain
VRTLLPWQLVRVDGPSMTPTLRPGDVLLVRHGATVRPGSVVLATFRSRPALAVVKRAVRPDGTGWWLSSDNSRAGSDSRDLGVADVHAVASWVFRKSGDGPLGRLRTVVPRRPAGDPGGL